MAGPTTDRGQYDDDRAAQKAKHEEYLASLEQNPADLAAEMARLEAVNLENSLEAMARKVEQSQKQG